MPTPSLPIRVDLQCSFTVFDCDFLFLDGQIGSHETTGELSTVGTVT